MTNDEFKEFNISDDIKNTLEKLGYTRPTEVQQKAIPVVLQGKDVIVKSQTGSGKTAAFGIPVCEKVEIENSNPQALILTPTRELCVQIKEELGNIGRYKKIRAVALYGKQPFSEQAKALKQRVHVAVGTPGRTLDHLDRGTLITEDIKYLIIDEADEMLNMGFIDQVESIINKISENRITMLFSATMSPEIEALSRKYMKAPVNIEISREEMTVSTIEQRVYEIEEDKKFKLLRDLIYVENPECAIMFCRTKENVDKLYEKLKQREYSVAAMHGGMLQKDRLAVINGFKNGKYRFLVATDVAARGIDVEDVSHIFNYDFPLEKESYVHRIGRTGRAGKSGAAITFVTPNENRFLKDTEEYIGYKIPQFKLPSQEEVQCAKDNYEEKVLVKKDKTKALNKEITKLYINAGKKKKIRALDIVGAISNIEGMNSEDIGIIEVEDSVSYVDIHNGKGKAVIEAFKEMTLKGKKVKVEKAKK